MSDFTDEGGGPGARQSICELSRDSWKQAGGHVSEAHWLFLVFTNVSVVVLHRCFLTVFFFRTSFRYLKPFTSSYKL